MKYLIVLIILATSCTQNSDYYHGYVYDAQTKKPLNNVLIKESIVQNPKSTHTNLEGYFRIEKNKESIADLIFSLNGFKKDTVATVWAQHGEKLMYRFLNKKTDTLFLRKVN